jgi:hypothetical protein
MPIEFRCIACRKLLRVGDADVGKKARCPDCGAIQGVESPLAEASDSDPAAGTAHWPGRPGDPGTFSDGPTPFAPSPAGPSGNPFHEPSPSGAVNPYASPSLASATQPLTGPAARLQAEHKVRPPAFAMLVVSTLSLALQLLVAIAVGFRFTGVGIGADAGLVLLQFLLPLGIHAIILLGAWEMLHLRRYALAVTASVLAMIPCVGLTFGGMCCLVSLPVGIWSIVVLNDPLVKRVFAEVASGRTNAS